MHAYCVTYDITNRSPKTIHVSKNSTFQIGVKVLDQNGKYIQSIKVKDENNTTLKQSGTLAEYRLYSATSGDSQGSKQWSVAFTKYTSAGAKNVKLPPLTIVTTSSDVAELPGGGNADLTDYYTKEEVDAKVNGVSEKVTALENAGYQTADQVQQDIEASLTGYSTTDEVNTLITEATAPLAPASSLTAYWKKDETVEHQLNGTYEDGTEFSFTAICKKA